MIATRRSSRERPGPERRFLLGHLPEWVGDPLGLLEEGARTGHPFWLKLGGWAVVGWRPDWNRRILSDRETFVSDGSFASRIPHLSGGVITTDAPEHGPRRDALNPSFFRPPRAETPMRRRIRATLDEMAPTGTFDAVEWSDRAVRSALNAALFDGAIPDRMLARYLRPLHRPMPWPLFAVPGFDRPIRRQVARWLRHHAAEPRDAATARNGTAPMTTADGDACPALPAAAFARVSEPTDEARVVLAAGHDTTAHALAWCIWNLATHPRWQCADGIEPVIRETLRLTPPGWVGSRRAARDTWIEGCHIPAGTHVLYSTWLTHRDPDIWPDPGTFDPARFRGRPEAWSWLPFGGGRRLCLGMRVAWIILEEALKLITAYGPRAESGDPSPVARLTLAPRGPLDVTLDSPPESPLRTGHSIGPNDRSQGGTIGVSNCPYAKPSGTPST